MKLRDLGPWVGITGATLRRRARGIGFQLDLKDEIDIPTANKLYRQLPVEHTMTINYKNPRKPEVDFIGPWNIQDWNRLFKKIQQEIMIRQREFIKAARKTEVKPEVKTEEIAPQVQQDQSASSVEAVLVDTAFDEVGVATSLTSLGPDVELFVSGKEHDDAGTADNKRAGEYPEGAGLDPRAGAAEAEPAGQPAIA